MWKNRSFDGKELPDPKKVDFNGYGKRISECTALVPPKLITARVHFIRKRDLLLVVCGEESNLCAQEVGEKAQRSSRREYLGEHPSKGASGIGTPRKAEDTYLVSILIYLITSGQG